MLVGLIILGKAIALLILNDVALADQAGELDIRALVIQGISFRFFKLSFKCLDRGELLLNLDLLFLSMQFLSNNLLLGFAPLGLNRKHICANTFGD